VILIWERQFVFAARAYLAARGGDAAADRRDASRRSAHRGVTTSPARRPAWRGGGVSDRHGERARGRRRDGARAERGEAIGRYPVMRVGHSPTPKSRPTRRLSLPLPCRGARVPLPLPSIRRVGNSLASPPPDPFAFPCTAVGPSPDVSFSTTATAAAAIATTIDSVSRQERIWSSGCLRIRNFASDSKP
jgi:hypothetical protein